MHRNHALGVDFNGCYLKEDCNIEKSELLYKQK